MYGEKRRHLHPCKLEQWCYYSLMKLVAQPNLQPFPVEAKAMRATVVRANEAANRRGMRAPSTSSGS